MVRDQIVKVPLIEVCIIERASENVREFPLDIQCVPEKRKPINRVNFSETVMIHQKKVYIVTKFSLSSFF